MAKKRLMDCNIWSKQNFRQLEPKLKLAWFYLITNCDHAGIFEIDMELMSFKIGESYTLDEVQKSFDKHIVDLGDSKWFLPAFIEFQYGLPLNPNVKVHLSVIKLLGKYGIDLGNSYEAVNNKDKDKSIDTRKKAFVKRVDKEIVGMGVNPQLQKEFIDYWSEHNDGGKVMRYEQQSIFNIKRRINTWIKNSKKFNSNTFQPLEEDLEKKEARIEADYKAQQERFKEADSNVADDDERKKALGLK